MTPTSPRTYQVSAFVFNRKKIPFLFLKPLVLFSLPFRWLDSQVPLVAWSKLDHNSCEPRCGSSPHLPGHPAVSERCHLRDSLWGQPRWLDEKYAEGGELFEKLVEISPHASLQLVHKSPTSPPSRTTCDVPWRTTAAPSSAVWTLTSRSGAAP